MSLFSWLGGQLGIDPSHPAARKSSRKATRRPPPRQRLRPQVEALEGRSLLATLTVTTSADETDPDDGVVSIREAIAAGQNADTIAFDPSLSGQTIRLTHQLEIDKSLKIQGLGTGQLAISGGYAVRAFQVDPGAQVTLSGLTIKEGNARSGSFDPSVYDGYGGGILNFGTLTMSNCNVSGNSATSYGRGGGGIYNSGTITITNTIISGNTAYDGGGIFNSGTLTISASTVTKNSASGKGGGIYNDFTGTITLINTKVSGNHADGGGNNDIYNLGKIYKSNKNG
jgi:predicted outer membrane repeat protein